jgi:hypothetical protein
VGGEPEFGFAAAPTAGPMRRISQRGSPTRSQPLRARDAEAIQLVELRAGFGLNWICANKIFGLNSLQFAPHVYAIVQITRQIFRRISTEKTQEQNKT